MKRILLLLVLLITSALPFDMQGFFFKRARRCNCQCHALQEARVSYGRMLTEEHENEEVLVMEDDDDDEDELSEFLSDDTESLETGAFPTSALPTQTPFVVRSAEGASRTTAPVTLDDLSSLDEPTLSTPNTFDLSELDEPTVPSLRPVSAKPVTAPTTLPAGALAQEGAPLTFDDLHEPTLSTPGTSTFDLSELDEPSVPSLTPSPHDADLLEEPLVPSLSSAHASAPAQPLALTDDDLTSLTPTPAVSPAPMPSTIMPLPAKRTTRPSTAPRPTPPTSTTSPMESLDDLKLNVPVEPTSSTAESDPTDEMLKLLSKEKSTNDFSGELPPALQKVRSSRNKYTPEQMDRILQAMDAFDDLDQALKERDLAERKWHEAISLEDEPAPVDTTLSDELKRLERALAEPEFEAPHREGDTEPEF